MFLVCFFTDKGVILKVHMVVCRPKRTLYSKKYGVDLIRYTHAANTVVYSSNKIDGMLMHKCLFVCFL